MHNYVIVSVDWEKDHGKWRYGSTYDGESRLKNVDYGGIIVGTRCFEDVLDELDIPCTWLVETHKDYPELDLPKKFPGLILRLKSREKDEIGTHIHWGRFNCQTERWEYPTEDTEWMASQIKYAREELASFGISPKSFRGGGFLHVPGLAKLLESQNYLIDSSTTLTAAKRVFTRRIVPYWPDIVDVTKTGNAKIAEFPVMFGMPLARKVWAKICTFRLEHSGGNFITLYMHIDVITSCESGPDELTSIDWEKVKQIKRFLQRLARIESVRFVTFAEGHRLAKAILKE